MSDAHYFFLFVFYHGDTGWHQTTHLDHSFVCSSHLWAVEREMASTEDDCTFFPGRKMQWRDWNDKNKRSKSCNEIPLLIPHFSFTKFEVGWKCRVFFPEWSRTGSGGECGIPGEGNFVHSSHSRVDQMLQEPFFFEPGSVLLLWLLQERERKRQRERDWEQKRERERWGTVQSWASSFDLPSQMQTMTCKYHIRGPIRHSLH